MASLEVNRPAITAPRNVTKYATGQGRTRPKSITTSSQCLKGSRRKKGRSDGRNVKPRVQKALVRPRIIIEYLPTEMITEIVARVAAASAADLFRCKQSCKILHEIADEKRVLQQAELEGLHSCQWRNPDKAQSFFDKCQKSNNPEALYELGMVRYFRQTNMKEGLKNIEQAAKQEHKGAIYALGLILLCSGDNQCINVGVKLLFNLMKSIKGEGIVERRRKLKDLMYALPYRRSLELCSKELAEDVSDVVLEPTIRCAMRELHKIESPWERGLEFGLDLDGKVEDSIVCKACKCFREAAIFCKLLRDTRSGRAWSYVEP